MWSGHFGSSQHGITPGSSRFEVPFDMCVEWCFTLDGVIESEEGSVVPIRGVCSAARDTGGRRERGCSGVADPGTRRGQWIPEELVSERIVEQIAQDVPVDRITDRIAECGCP